MQKLTRYAAIPALLFSLGGIATAASPDKGYLVETNGQGVKDSYGECVRSESPSQVPPGCGAAAPETPKSPSPRYERAIPTPTPGPVTTKTSLEGKALFASGKYTLKPAGRASLDKLVRDIKSTPGVQSIHVIGYTDSKGSASQNQRLSEQRALTVKSYLQSRGLRNITSEGRGSADPVASNATEAGRTQNRRVEVEVITE